MNKRLEAILEDARRLTTQERRELLERLDLEFHHDFPDDSADEIAAAWLQEVDSRLASLERGEAKFSASYVVKSRLRERLAKS
ncbi:MAG: addiction module protein [Alphaproteobacteria bacterium]|nr:addiction module protein [Alphaproteobacteria bacterium]